MSAFNAQRLDSLCDLVTEQVDPATTPNALYLGLEHLAPGRLTRVGGGLGSEVQSHKFRFQRNDVLYGKLRPYLDKAILADADGVCTTELLVLRPKPGIDPKFLACVVHDSDFIGHATAGVTGAHHPRTSWNHIAEFLVTAFDQTEQSRIASMLWRIHDLLLAGESALQAAERLKRVAMRELFTRGLRGESLKVTEVGSMPESWEIRPFADVVLLQRGFDLPVSAREEGTVVVYGSNGPVGKHNHAPEAPYPGVMVGRSGSVGKVSFSSDPYWPLNTTLYAADYRGNDPMWVRYWLEHFDLSRFSQGVSVPTLNRNTFAHVPVGVPSLHEQKDIAAVLKAIDQKIDLHVLKRAAVQNIFKSLLRKLMIGEVRTADLDLSILRQGREKLLA